MRLFVSFCAHIYFIPFHLFHQLHSSTRTKLFWSLFSVFPFERLAICEFEWVLKSEFLVFQVFLCDCLPVSGRFWFRRKTKNQLQKYDFAPKVCSSVFVASFVVHVARTCLNFRAYVFSVTRRLFVWIDSIILGMFSQTNRMIWITNGEVHDSV